MLKIFLVLHDFLCSSLVKKIGYRTLSETFNRAKK